MPDNTPARITGYINIYRSGLYHTPGKPGAYDRHPGDIYATEAAAIEDIYPHSHYVDHRPGYVGGTDYAIPQPDSACRVSRQAA
jgi:hypothetical protein